jgi:hypothetical protein
MQEHGAVPAVVLGNALGDRLRLQATTTRKGGPMRITILGVADT